MNYIFHKMTSFPENAHSIITKLKFISLIKPGEKIDTRNLTSTQSTKLNSFWRWWIQEDRNLTIPFLSKVVNDSFDMIKLTQLNNKPLAILIINDLLKINEGITNLENTYTNLYNDRLFHCHIETLISCINIKINQLRESNPELFIAPV